MAALNDFGLPADVLASLQPVDGGYATENGPQRVSWSPEQLHAIAVENYRTSLPHEHAYRARLMERIRSYVYWHAWELSGGDWGFSRKNLAAYAAFEKNFELAGKVTDAD